MRFQLKMKTHFYYTSDLKSLKIEEFEDLKDLKI